jgi:hypothetical protein
MGFDRYRSTDSEALSSCHGVGSRASVVSDILAVIVATTIVVPSAFLTTQLAGLGPRLFEDFKRVRVISKLPENMSGTSFARKFTYFLTRICHLYEYLFTRSELPRIANW